MPSRMNWSAVVGQERVKSMLRSAIESGRVAHAYLFSGPEGAGMDAAALVLARVVNCIEGGTEACGRCASCVRGATLQDPNVNLIVALPVGKAERQGDDPLAKLTDEEVAGIQRELRLKAANPYYTLAIPKANAIKINSIRQIRREASLSLYDRGRRVFILLDADLMNAESSNALLKTLEEPHADTLLILTTTRPDQLMPTILSRCQHLRFDPLGEAEVAAALRDRIDGMAPEDAVLIARMAQGNFARALAMVGTDFSAQRAQAVEFVRTVLYKPRHEMGAAVDLLAAEKDRSVVVAFLRMLEDWFSDAQHVREGVPLAVAEADRTALEKFAAHHGGVDYRRVEAVLARAVSLVDKNVYIPLILMNVALDLRRVILTPDAPRGRPGAWRWRERNPFEGSV